MGVNKQALNVALGLFGAQDSQNAGIKNIELECIYHWNSTAIYNTEKSQNICLDHTQENIVMQDTKGKT